jgi:hypothetical protein
MLKTILILLILVFVKAQGMLVPRIMPEASGALCSAGGYYCMFKGIKDWSRSSGTEQDKKRFYSYLGVAAGLTAASLVINSPDFSTNEKRNLWLIKEIGALYMGMGLCLIESGIRKHDNELLQQKAKQDVGLGVMLMVWGGYHVAVPAIIEGRERCTT